MTGVFVKNATGADLEAIYSARVTLSTLARQSADARPAAALIPCAKPALKKDAGNAPSSSSMCRKLVG